MELPEMPVRKTIVKSRQSGSLKPQTRFSRFTNRCLVVLVFDDYTHAIQPLPMVSSPPICLGGTSWPPSHLRCAPLLLPSVPHAGNGFTIGWKLALFGIKTMDPGTIWLGIRTWITA